MNATEPLNADRVRTVFLKCLFGDAEDTTKHIKAEGILSVVAFHPQRLEEHREEIAAMLDELPDDFKARGGGGTSFLNACYDKHGNQWTGLHQTMEQLFQLGIATEKVVCLIPRERWKLYPGGMPYYQIK